MNYQERVNLRFALLKGLYDDYFASGGSESKIVLDLEETERHLALLYLADKKLINCRLINNEFVLEFMVKITAKGIDAVENNISLQSIGYERKEQ